ncbi:hypothetical protein THIOKS12950013 [Thiocapsa sp. KS1]|nr:hypothetical protein THIOKS12950013 [Thiocapsa sp. KS1]
MAAIGSVDPGGAPPGQTPVALRAPCVCPGGEVLQNLPSPEERVAPPWDIIIWDVTLDFLPGSMAHQA